mgnify:CR=1 FL=1
MRRVGEFGSDTERTAGSYGLGDLETDLSGFLFGGFERLNAFAVNLYIVK